MIVNRFYICFKQRTLSNQTITGCAETSWTSQYNDSSSFFKRYAKISRIFLEFSSILARESAKNVYFGQEKVKEGFFPKKNPTFCGRSESQRHLATFPMGFGLEKQE